MSEDLRERARRVLMSFRHSLAAGEEALIAEFVAIRAEAESARELEVQELYTEAQELGRDIGWDGAVKALRDARATWKTCADWLASEKPSRIYKPK